MLSNPLDELYRLVVVLRRNIDLLGKCSTREGSRMCSALPKLLQNFANFNKVEKNELHYRQYQQYQQYYNHQHYNQRLLRLRLTRHHRRSFGFASLAMKCRSAPLTLHSLTFGSTLFSSLASLDYYYHHHRRWWGGCYHHTTYSPPFGRFVSSSSSPPPNWNYISSPYGSLWLLMMRWWMMIGSSN